MAILVLLIGLAMQSAVAHTQSGVLPAHGSQQSRASASRQLLAVRGEVIRIATAGKGLLSITIKPAKDFDVVTVLVRENDQVGSGVAHESDVDLLDLLAGDDVGADEKITAAELQK